MRETRTYVGLDGIAGSGDSDVESLFADADFAAEGESACAGLMEGGECKDGASGRGEREGECGRGGEVSVE